MSVGVPTMTTLPTSEIPCLSPGPRASCSPSCSPSASPASARPPSLAHAGPTSAGSGARLRPMRFGDTGWRVRVLQSRLHQLGLHSEVDHQPLRRADPRRRPHLPGAPQARDHRRRRRHARGTGSSPSRPRRPARRCTTSTRPARRSWPRATRASPVRRLQARLAQAAVVERRRHRCLRRPHRRGRPRLPGQAPDPRHRRGRPPHPRPARRDDPPAHQGRALQHRADRARRSTRAA